MYNLLLVDAFNQGLNNDFPQIVIIILNNPNKEADSAKLVSIARLKPERHNDWAYYTSILIVICDTSSCLVIKHGKL